VTPGLAGDIDDTRAARAVLSLSGVKAGLCVHIGCGRDGSPGLTAELAKGSGMLVHGICWDTTTLVRARDAIAANNVLGQASAETLGDGPLPYVRHLCNLVVVEDMKAAAAHGVGYDELMRVLAPGGTLCVLAEGRWTKTIRPRPEGMDDWTHPHHGPDGNMVSTDRLARFPVGLRWIGSTAKSINKWTGVRGWVLANGRCHIVSSSEIENLGLEEKTHYLVCRDAFNGLPLWKIPLATVESGGALYWRNTSPLAADDQRVYAAGERRAIIVDGATGNIEHTIATKYQVERMVLLDNTLVLSCWKEREETTTPFERGGLWGPRVNHANEGSTEAYANDTGELLWKLDYPAYSVLARDGVVYLLTRNANPATANTITALDIRSGKELWRVAHTELGDHPAENVFGKVRPVERGPAFARARPASCDTNAWPMQLAKPTRNRSTAGAAPVALDILWQASAAQPNAGPLKAAWDARLAPVVTPPVASDGRVFVASTTEAPNSRRIRHES
jgi:hypothetical protein